MLYWYVIKQQGDKYETDILLQKNEMDMGEKMTNFKENLDNATLDYQQAMWVFWKMFFDEELRKLPPPPFVRNEDSFNNSRCCFFSQFFENNVPRRIQIEEDARLSANQWHEDFCNEE